MSISRKSADELLYECSVCLWQVLRLARPFGLSKPMRRGVEKTMRRVDKYLEELDSTNHE